MVYQNSLFTVVVNRFLVLMTIFTMSKNQKQRICLKFCVSNKISFEALKNGRKDNSWILHCDNASSHTSMLVRNILAKNSNIISQILYLPWSPVTFFYSQNSNYHFVESVLNWQKL